MLKTLNEDKKWTLKDNNKLSLKLRLEGGLSIRRYSTECSDEESSPDQEQLTTIKFDKNGSPEEVAVIPGTSWAGAIGHRMEELIDCSKVKKFERGKDDIQTYYYFGTVNSKVKEKSLIYFNESKLTGGQFKKNVQKCYRQIPWKYCRRRIVYRENIHRWGDYIGYRFWRSV